MKRVFEGFRFRQMGFTLIELLVVIAILGTLSAIAIPNLAGLIGRGEDEAAKAEWRIIQTAVVAYMVVHQLNTVTAMNNEQVLTSNSIIGEYMSTNSGWLYSWNNTGMVTQGTKVSSK
jgi:prepilin-type N-terminal cleavage/methylation domain-containing protein